MTAAISTVEDVLGLPSPQQLATTDDQEGEGVEKQKEEKEKEKEEGEGEGEGEKKEEGGVETLAKLAESKKHYICTILSFIQRCPLNY